MSLLNKLYDNGRNLLYASAVASLLSPNYSSAQPPMPNLSPEEIQAMDAQRITRESELEIKTLYSNYESLLEKKAKLNPSRKQEMRLRVYPVDIDPLRRLESMKKTLLIEQDPEQYLKQYVKDEEEIKRIRAIELTQTEKQDYKQKVFNYLKFNPNNLDLSDKIKVYLNRKGLLYKTQTQAKKEAAEDISRGIVNPLIDLFEKGFRK